jgi:hypothetical protein
MPDKVRETKSREVREYEGEVFLGKNSAIATISGTDIQLPLDSVEITFIKKRRAKIRMPYWLAAKNNLV